MKTRFATRLRFLCRLPPFGWAYIASVGALIGLSIWILLDSSFDIVLDELTQYLRINPDGGLAPYPDALCSRGLLLGLMSVLSVPATATVFLRLSIGPTRGRTIRTMLLTTLLVAGWLGLFTGYRELWWLGVRFRLAQRFPDIKAARTELLREWPNYPNDVTLQGLGRYRADLMAWCNALCEVHEDSSGSRLSEYPFHERVTHIWRTNDGGLRFDLSDNSRQRLDSPHICCRVEYRFQGAQPHSFTEDFAMGHYSVYNLVRWTSLDEHWYLVYYSSDIVGLNIYDLWESGEAPLDPDPSQLK